MKKIILLLILAIVGCHPKVQVPKPVSHFILFVGSDIVVECEEAHKDETCATLRKCRIVPFGQATNDIQCATNFQISEKSFFEEQK